MVFGNVSAMDIRVRGMSAHNIRARDITASVAVHADGIIAESRIAGWFHASRITCGQIAPHSKIYSNHVAEHGMRQRN